MLIAIPRSGDFKGARIRCHGIVNRGGWFGESYLAIVTIANALHAAIIIEADNAQDALDELADSHWSHLIDIDSCNYCDTTEAHCDCHYAEYAGNDSHRIMTDYLTTLVECDVDYFG